MRLVIASAGVVGTLLILPACSSNKPSTKAAETPLPTPTTSVRSFVPTTTSAVATPASSPADVPALNDWLGTNRLQAELMVSTGAQVQRDIATDDALITVHCASLAAAASDLANNFPAPGDDQFDALIESAEDAYHGAAETCIDGDMHGAASGLFSAVATEKRAEARLAALHAAKL